jgi:glutathione S-transferase
MTKPVVYTFTHSVWAAVAEIAVAELNVDVEFKQVVLINGENFEPSFLKINSKGTLPTLTVGSSVYTDTTAVVSYLNSTVPTPVAKATDFTGLLHEDKYDPNFALLLARNDEELKAKAGSIPGVFVANRQAALERISATPEAAEFKTFYAEKLAANGGLLRVYKGEVPEEAKNGFFQVSTGHVANIRDLILHVIPAKLPASGFLGGARPGEDDFHLIGWLARIASTVFASNDANGILAYEKELGVPVPPSVVSYWKLWVERSSFKTVYAAGLH